MSYTINKTDGTKLITPIMPAGQLLDGSTDSSTGVTLLGRNVVGYGNAQNQNFINLLQNFANDAPPGGGGAGFAPLIGTLWYDTAKERLKIYNGTEFVTVSPLVESDTQPVANKIGDQWWDTACLLYTSDAADE